MKLVYVVLALTMLAGMVYVVGVYPKELLCRELSPLGVTCTDPVLETALGGIVSLFQELVAAPIRVAMWLNNVMGG